MNKTIIIIFIAVILIIGFAAYNYSQSTPELINGQQSSQGRDNQKSLIQGPKVKVSPDAYDFGRVIYGQVAKHNFTLTNLGNQPLKILRLSTSCGCTQASMAEKDKTIAPGASAL